MRRALPRPFGAPAATVGTLSVIASLFASAPAAGLPDTTGSASLPGSSLSVTDSGPRLSPGAAEAVTPDVREVAVSEVGPARRPALAARSGSIPVDGFGVVGATWRGATPRGLRLVVRSRDGDGWSAWTELHWSDSTAEGTEGAGGRGGTDPLAVGEVDSVQLRATSATGRAPRDLELSVVDPGSGPLDDGGSGALTTADGNRTAAAARGSGVPVLRPLRRDTKGVRAPLPRIRLRAAWGADERMRSSSPSYGRVTAGIVHHTVNSNDYSRSDVPAIIRGIYAYHTQSLGWSDIGYNFLIDRFGRKWVGRYGGPRRALVGAHTYGYNHLSTGVAAIGNFETRLAPDRMKRAFGRLLGWRLGLAEVRVGGRYRWMEGERFRAISGHRNAGQTACPGTHLYRRLDGIRRVAIGWQER